MKFMSECYIKKEIDFVAIKRREKDAQKRMTVFPVLCSRQSYKMDLLIELDTTLCSDILRELYDVIY